MLTYGRTTTDLEGALFYIGLVPLTCTITWHGVLYDARGALAL